MPKRPCSNRRLLLMYDLRCTMYDCNGSATGLQRVCNGSATGLQRVCNGSATDLPRRGGGASRHPCTTYDVHRQALPASGALAFKS